MSEKPTTTCELLMLEPVAGYPVGIYRAHIHRTSKHPRLGEDRPGVTTLTSKVLRVDFERRTIETLNTIYKY